MSEKLQKVLARAGHGSRREIETIIEAGRVSVDGKIATLGDRVEIVPGLKIRIDGHLISVKESAEQICRVLAAMILRGAPANFILHINVSAIQLLQQDFAWHLMDAIYRHGLVTGNICLEITERLLMNDAVRISRMIAYLRRHGIAVALDCGRSPRCEHLRLAAVYHRW